MNSKQQETMRNLNVPRGTTITCLENEVRTYEVEFYVHERRTVLKTANTPEEAKKAVLEGEYNFHESHECTTLRGGIRIIGE
jgi:hypothetical protein